MKDMTWSVRGIKAGKRGNMNINTVGEETIERTICGSSPAPSLVWCGAKLLSVWFSFDSQQSNEIVCKRGLLNKIKPYGFTLFIKRYGIEKLLDCLEENEKRGIRYHRKGIIGWRLVGLAGLTVSAAGGFRRILHLVGGIIHIM